MRNTTITEENGLWIVTVAEPLGKPQRYYCDNQRLARRWALLFSGPVKDLKQPAA